MRKNFAKIILISVVVLMMCIVPAYAEKSGSIGDNITWTLSDDGTLSLSGNGEFVLESESPYVNPVAPWSEDRESIKKVVIGEGIINVDNYAFEQCTAMEELVIPDSVTVIEAVAFSGCDSLKALKIGKNVEVIEFAAFSSCDALESIEWGEKLLSIGDSAFEYCSSLTSVDIPDGVVDLGNYSFSNASNLASITIPDSVKEVKSHVLWSTAYENNSANWENEILYVSNHLVEANISSAKDVINIRPGTVSIASYAFRGSRRITEIVIPDSVRYIGEGAFYGCEKLKKCLIPNSVKEMGGSVFYGCEALEEFRLSEAINEIPESTFEGANLKTYTVPGYIKRIGDRAFYECANLESITISEGVEYIGMRAIAGCPLLTEITVPDSVTELNGSFLDDCSGVKKVIIGDGLKESGGNYFYGCPSLETLIMGDGADYDLVRDLLRNLTTLKHITFGDGYKDELYNLDSYLKNKSIIETLVLGNGLTTIDSDEFEDYTSLKNITLGNNIEEIGMDAFSKTPFYKDEANWENGVLYVGNYLIEVKPTVENLVIKEGTTLIAHSAAQGITALKSVTFPESLKYICDQAFQNCSNLKEIELGEGIVDTGYNAFYYTGYYKDATKWDGDLLYSGTNLIHAKGNLTEVSVKEGTTCVGSRAFANSRTTIKKITLPESLKYISGGAFYSCTVLSEINLPKSLERIGENAFFQAAITSVVISEGVLEIVNNAFSQCKALVHVEINGGKIGDSAFGNCSALKDLYINEGVTSIGEFAFSNCKELKKVKIPGSVKEIKNAAFYGCSSLEKMYIEAEIEKLENICESGNASVNTITIPKTVKEFDRFGSSSNTTIKDIYYEGSRADWEKIENYDDIYESITIHYGEAAPAELWIKSIVIKEGESVNIKLDLTDIPSDGRVIGIMRDSGKTGGIAVPDESSNLTFDGKETGKEIKIICFESPETLKPACRPEIVLCE